MTPLPHGWETVPLHQLITFSIGGLWGSDPATPGAASTLVAVMRAADYRNWAWERAARAAVRQVATKALESRLLQLGDLVVEVSGGGPTQPVGRAVLIDEAALRSTELPLILSNFCRRVVLTSQVNPRFVYYQLLHKYIIGETERFQTSTTNIRNLNFSKYVAETAMRVAPALEQERIVAAIEEQFSRLDVGVAALERVLAELDAYGRASILAAIPEPYPPSWRRTTVGQAGEVALGRQRSPRFHAGPNLRPYLRVANVFEDRIDTSDVMSMHFDASDFERFRLRPDDILLNEGQSPHLLGRPAMYRGDPPDVAFTNSLIRFRCGAEVTPEWALLVFRRHLHAKRFMRESQITTNIAHLSAGRFKTVEFPVPPVVDQKRICADVQEQLANASRIRKAVESQLTRASALRTSLLETAFSGCLVHQDIADEPASVLLERIATERGSSNGKQTLRARSRGPTRGRASV